MLSAQQVTVGEYLDSAMQLDEEGRPKFPPAKDIEKSFRVEGRKVLVPPHRLTAVKSNVRVFGVPICPLPIGTRDMSRNLPPGRSVSRLTIPPQIGSTDSEIII